MGPVTSNSKLGGAEVVANSTGSLLLIERV
jgi:hypothetical protein